MTILSLIVPGIPASLNASYAGHWTKRDRLRRDWAEKMQVLLLDAGCRRGKVMFQNEVAVSLHYRVKTRTRKQRPDLDNLAPKNLIDGMIGYVFPDDQAIRLLVQSIEYDADQDETIVSVKPLTD